MAPQRQMALPSAPDVGRKDGVLCMDTCSLTLRPKTKPEQGFWGAWPRLGEGGRRGHEVTRALEGAGVDGGA